MLVAKLNSLAKSNISVIIETKLFTKDFIDNWSVKTEELVNQYNAIQDIDEKKSWLNLLFAEFFQLLYQPELPKNITISSLAKFIDDLTFSSKDQTIIGQMFVAASNSFSKEDDKKLTLLTKGINSIQEELFKFSWVSSKLMIKEQTSLQRHLLKKSKYELKKYNLLFESPIGYSQLITLLFLAYNDSANTDKIPFYVDELYHIMGKYSLDSLRSLDIILNVSSEFLTNNYNFFLQFLKATNFWPKDCTSDNFQVTKLNKGGNMIASNIIAFNINSFQEGDDVLKYLDMCCLLIKHGFVNFSSIWENISPRQDTLELFLNEYEKNLEEESLKGSDNPLAMASALADDDDSEEEDTLNKDDTHSIDTNNIRGNAKKQEPKILKEETYNLQLSNLKRGKLQFLQRLLIHGCTVPAFFTLQNNPKLLCIEDATASMAGRVFQNEVEDFYKKFVIKDTFGLTDTLHGTFQENGLISNKARLITRKKSHNPINHFELQTKYEFYYPEWCENLLKVDSINSLIERTHVYFSILGPYLAKCPKLIVMICRIGTKDLKNAERESKEAKMLTWVDFIRKFIMPTIPLLGSNSSVTSEIYELMELIPFEKRYFMYNEMITKTSQDVLLIKVSFNKAEREARNMLKALSIDTIEKDSRKFANLISTNPLATLLPVVKQIENYDKVSELVIVTAEYFNNFAYDVLQYVLLLRLSHGRAPVQSDGVNQTMWVMRLSSFIALLTKRCSKMNIRNIISYVVKTLHQGNIISISILKELITTVAGIRDLNDVNSKQLTMLNSGESLKRTARKLIYDFRDSNREQANKLVSLFVEQDTISEVLLLLYNLNRDVNSQNLHYKILSTRYDELNSLLWSFVELVKYCCNSQEFSENIIPFDKLINEYQMSTAWSFNIWRDKMTEGSSSDNAPHLKKFENVTFSDIDFSAFNSGLFFTFWQLSLYDIRYSESLYNEIKTNLENGMNTAATSREKNGIAKDIKNLLSAQTAHQEAYISTKELLNEKIQAWSPSFSKEAIMKFIQYCIVPRSLFSPSDALYSASFLCETFDDNVLSEIFSNFISSKILRSLLFTCTTLEAGNLGIFFTTLIENLENTRKGYELESNKNRDLYDLYDLLTNQIVFTLLEKNYMSIRNGIEFMRHVTNCFPIVNTHIELVKNTLEKNRAEEEREDIKLPSTALLGHLKARLRQSIKLSEFCSLTSSELKSHELYEKELAEVKKYKKMLENEKKQEILRKQIEDSRRNRNKSENKETAVSIETNQYQNINIPTGPSSTRNKEDPQFQKQNLQIIRMMREITHNLKSKNLKRIISLINDERAVHQINNITDKANDIDDFRKLLTSFFERYFKGLISNQSNVDFIQAFDEIKKGISRIDSPWTRSNKPNRDIYSEGSTSYNANSRYNSETSRDRYSDSKQNIKLNSTIKGTDPSKFNNRFKSQRLQGQYEEPDKSSTRYNDGKYNDHDDISIYSNKRSRSEYPDSRLPPNSRSSYDSSVSRRYDINATDERSTKRYKGTDSNSDVKYPEHRKGGDKQDRNKGHSRFNESKRDESPKLPQGPKSSSSFSQSRFQK